MEASKSSFEKVYPKVSLVLTKFIAKKVGSKPEAVDEVFSRTIVAAWKGWGSFRYKSSYLTWFCSIAIRKIADYYREQVNESSMLITPALEAVAGKLVDKNYSPEEQVCLHELRASIRQCLNLIPKEKAKILYLRYWKELTIKEIAKQLDTSERAVEGKIYRAKKIFKKIFEVNYILPSKLSIPKR